MSEEETSVEREARGAKDCRKGHSIAAQASAPQLVEEDASCAGIAEVDAAVVAGATDSEQPATARKGGWFGGMDAREAAALAHESRRQNRAEREAAADLDKLSVLARAGVVAARVLTYAEQVALLEAMIEKAKQGHVQAARFVLDWLVKLGPSDEGDGDVDKVLDPKDMTPAQRAVVRAELLRAIAERAGESDEFAGAA